MNLRETFLNKSHAIIKIIYTYKLRDILDENTYD